MLAQQLSNADAAVLIVMILGFCGVIVACVWMSR